MSKCLYLFILMTFFMLSGCTEKSLDFSFGNAQSLSGSFAPLVSSSSFSIASVTCTSPVASIYNVDSNGFRIDPAVSTVAVNSDGSYAFPIKTLGLNFDNTAPQDAMVVIITGCSSGVYSRPITGAKNQDVSMGSTLISYLANTNSRDQLRQALIDSTSDVNSLIQSVSSAASLDDAYTLLTTDATIQNQFQTLFGVAPTVLNDAAPQIMSSSISLEPPEVSAWNSNIAVSHWNSSYTPAYEWKLDGNVLSTSTSLGYTFNANSQGSHTLILTLGEDDGTGHVDATKPTQVLTKPLTVLNSVLPAALSFSVTTPVISGSTPINTRNVTLTMITGVAMANCASFSNLALTENDITTPSAGDFTISCTQNNTQDINYTLSSAGDGIKTLRLWAIDASGMISLVPTMYSLTLDTTAPVMTISTTPTSPSNSSSQSFSFSANDGIGTIDHYECQIDAGGWSTCTSPQSYTGLAEGSHTFSARAIDTGSNVSNVDSKTWSIDLTPPTVTITTPAADGSVALATSLTSFSVAGTCTENGLPVTFSGASTASATCLAGTWSTAIDLSGLSDGTLSLTASQTDSAGNTAGATRTLIKDTIAPAISITAPVALQGNSATGTVTWTLTESHVANATSFTVEIYDGSSWSTIGTPAATAGANSNQSYTLSGFNVPNVTTSNAAIRVTLVDAAGNSGVSQTGTFLIDSSLPTLANFSIGVASPTTNNNVPISFQASDNDQIASFCLKYNTVTTPTSTDSCWVPVENAGVTAAANVTISNYYFRVGYTSGLYTVHVWAKDRAGNISLLQQTGDDTAAITFNASPPPTVTQVMAASNDTPSSPEANSDLTIPAGQSVYIKWEAASTAGFGATPIQLYYTTDDNTWTPIGSPVANSANGGCTLTGSYTGCYVWSNGSPSTFYFRVRAKATDTAGLSAQNNSAFLNATAFTFHVGNTESGVGGSAASGVFLNVTQSDPRAGDHHSLIVTPSGKVYFRDATRGILKVDPSDGILSVLIPATGVSSGDGGDVSLATLNSPMAIALDPQNNLLIYDSDRIRKVDFSTSPATINTIIGGGTDSTDDTLADPLQLAITVPLRNTLQKFSFFSIPNGDIIFKPDCPMPSSSDPTCTPKYRWYHASTHSITSFYIHGYGISAAPTLNVNLCALRTLAPILDSSNNVQGFAASIYINPNSATDPTCSYDSQAHSLGAVFDTTGNFQKVYTSSLDTGLDQYALGKDGKIYSFVKYLGYLQVYNSSTNSWTILDNTGVGYCNDGTALASCNLTLDDIYVDSNSKIYLAENGRIRTVDDNGNMLSLLGQPLNYGDGLAPSLSRFAWITSIGLWNDGTNDRLVILDQKEHYLKEVSLGSGGTTTSIAGNGIPDTPSTASAATTQPILDANSNVFTYLFGIDTSGNIYMQADTNMIGVLNRSTGKWAKFVGKGATSYVSGDGLAGTNVKFGGLSGMATVYGYGNGQIVAGINTKNGTNHVDNPDFKLYNTTTGVQSSLSTSSITNFTHDSWCADGTSLSNCSIPVTSVSQHPAGVAYDSFAGAWLFAFSGLLIPDYGIRKLTPGGNMVTYFTPSGSMQNFAIDHTAGHEYIYYCDTSVASPIIRKADMSTTPPTITTLSWPVPSITCDGYNMIYSSSRNSLMFIYKQNGLYGVIEYPNP